MQTTLFFGLTVNIFIYAWPATLQVAIGVMNTHTKSVNVRYDTENFTLSEDFHGCYVYTTILASTDSCEHTQSLYMYTSGPPFSGNV